jgi:hypothetical protein
MADESAGMFYNMSYILCNWKLGFWEIGAKIFVFQEVYETLLYLLAPFVLPISLIVKPAFCAYLMLGTLGLYYLNVTVSPHIAKRSTHSLQDTNHRSDLQRDPPPPPERTHPVESRLPLLHALQDPLDFDQRLQLLLLAVEIRELFRQKVNRYHPAATFTHERPTNILIFRHPKIVEDEKAIEVVLRLEETAPAKDKNAPASGGGRRLTVTTIGSRVSWDAVRNTTRDSRGSRTSNAASVSVTPGVGGDITNPPRVLLLQRLPSTAESEHEGDGRPRPRPVSGLPNVYADVPVELARTDTVDFAATTTTTVTTP